eukprot:CAMPEP_0202901130 /NCGR_PEP_ID=MMETSP1392-20130828/13453_1 /ASSEMBLY_ACC=CAM_ASM_000868 /TAXON_ID=225041 /ORGANISM="Chlamydomonas chlamydogama, Strain SAG 11-48b" /LENGTH=311 /DNA_ID=CAMNT_0049587639 /DNA_START=88 /DNA_END=1023 /DNA_ORIENTATION=+
MNTRTSARTGLSSRAPLRSSRVTYSRSRLACNAKVNVEQLKAAQEELRTYIQSKYCNPIIVRLAWHDSGTYNKEVQGWPAAGGANGSIRFQPEIGHAANAGLKIAIGLLNPIKKKFPEVSYADLYQLASAVAVEVAGGPKIPMRYGRKDVESAEGCSPDGNLPSAGHPFPDGSVSPAEHLRKVFYRMGFNDQEIVALSGGHTLGRSRPDRSGWGKAETKYTKEGPGTPGGQSWTIDWLTFNNSYFTEVKAKRDAELLVLPTDAAIFEDEKFRPYAEKYAADEKAFFADYAKAHAKLSELGVAWEEGAPVTI